MVNYIILLCKLYFVIDYYINILKYYENNNFLRSENVWSYGQMQKY